MTGRPPGLARTPARTPPGHAACLPAVDQAGLSYWRPERWPACGLLAGHAWAVWLWGGGPAPWEDGAASGEAGP